MDRVSKECRSYIMKCVPQKNTKPEIRLRQLLHRAGFRFRLHRKDLPGRPDLVLPKLGVAIFVHGCYWHRHPNCVKATVPASNRAFWRKKFQDNVNRDARTKSQLEVLGWRVIIVWECEIASPQMLMERLSMEFLGTL